MALIKCKECGTEISNKAESCPKCGAKVSKSSKFGTLITVIGALYLFSIAWRMISPSQSINSNSETSTIPADEFKTTAEEISQQYESNSVLADSIYKGKRFQVSGVISDIRTDLMDHAVIDLKGSANQFLEPQFELNDSEKELAARYNKGEYTLLSCVGAGDIAKTPMNKDCYFSR